MENPTVPCNEDEHMELPPGFRFHPTDEELISHYLSPKVLNNGFSARAIGEVDLNKCEPWDLPRRAKMGEKEWYFFCQRDRKYPTGLRTNRATDAGYWKATGKDKEIYKAKTLVGMKKTLVFYRGRAPKGEKSNWVMHEYRLEGKYSLYSLSKSTKNEWVICRIFQKNNGGKKTHFSGLVLSPYGNELHPSLLPPLLDSPPFNNSDARTAVGKTTSSSHVTCFSNPMEDQKSYDQEMMETSFNHNHNNNNNNSPLLASSNASSSFPFYSNQIPQSFGNLSFADSVLMQDQSVLNILLERGSKTEFSQETDVSSMMSNQCHDMARRPFEDQTDPSSSAGPVDLDCLWNY